jgi:hypothetical protein
VITVKVVSPLSLKNAGPSGEVQLPERTTVGGMLVRAGAPLPAHILPAFVNGSLAKKSQKLNDGDLIVLLLPFSGG